MKIGIFDSGYGGLSVLHSAFCKIDAEFIYYADENMSHTAKNLAMKFCVLCTRSWSFYAKKASMR